MLTLKNYFSKNFITVFAAKTPDASAVTTCLTASCKQSPAAYTPEKSFTLAI